MVYKIALAGNPNSGKTTLFNLLTGEHGHVGNWPGVTVERKEGRIKNFKYDAVLVDLPGIYSLSPHSTEEVIARNYILNEKPDLVINIVDASNIERNLYLTLQILETGAPVIIAFNMIDVLRKKGSRLKLKAMADALKVPMVKISASRAEGIDELRGKILSNIESSAKRPLPRKNIVYNGDIRSAVKDIAGFLPDCLDKNHRQWTALKILEDDDLVKKEIKLDENSRYKIFSILRSVSEKYSMDTELLLACSRYKFIENLVQRSVVNRQTSDRESLTDKIDKILTHHFLAVPIFLAVMLLIFQITFGWLGGKITHLLEEAASLSIEWVRKFIFHIGAPGWLASLAADGIMTGVGAVGAFLPQIMLMYFFLGLLEDTGYMARAAFIMDRLMKKTGLSGKAFVPMIMGFGCSVPAIMAARTLENERDRKITIMVIPFMSCSAKMPVYAVITSAFFAENKGLIIFSLYLLGIVMSVFSGFLLKRFLYKGKISTFVMELPPYRLPTLRTLLGRIRQQILHFLQRAGTVLLGASVVIWFLQSFDFSLNMVDDNSQSILGSIGRMLVPLFKPLGFGRWEASVAVLTGLAAKESIVSTLSVLFNSEGTGLVSSLQQVLTPLPALSFIIFILLYVPCAAALATAKKELNSWRSFAAAVVWQLGIAWLVSFGVFQVGRALGLG